MKKRIAAALLTLVLCLVPVLSACSGGNSSADGVAVPAGTKLLSPDTADYYLFISDDWRTDISTGVVTAYFSESDPSNISMMVFSLGGSEMNYSQYWDSYAGQFSEIYSDYTLEESGETLLGGVAAGKYVYTGSFAAGTTAGDETTAETTTAVSLASGDYKFMTVVAVRADNIYILIYSAKASVYESHLSDFSDVITNFAFKN